MDRLTQHSQPSYRAMASSGESPAEIMRIKSEDLLHDQRVVEIDHQGRIYRLRLTQLNKLILTA